MTSTIEDCVPLSLALKHKKIGVSLYLLQLASLQEHRQRSDGWNKGVHPLINAISAGSIEMVYLISRNLADINDYISGPYTPLLHAVLSADIRYVRLILQLGANINKPSLNGISPLIASIFSSTMSRVLLSANPNLNHQDDDGNTALHVAAASKQIESVQVLINAEADVRIRNNDKMMPLMVASVNINPHTVMDLCELDEYFQIEKIEALEVLSACSVGFRYPLISYWFRALEMRNPRFPKILDVPTQKVLDFSQEFTTRDELKSLHADQLKLAFQGILVIERILGRNNFVYLRLLLQTTLIAKEENKLEKVQQLMDYIVEYCQEKPAHIVGDCSHFFQILFTEISSNDNAEKSFEIGAFDLFKIIARAMVEMWLSVKDKYSRNFNIEHTKYSELADTFLYITEKIRNMNLPDDFKGQFSEVVGQVVKEDPRFIHHHSLLHRVVKSTKKETWASVELIRFLLESGANINSKDYFRRTPLIYALMYGPDNRIRDILELLIEYKCHPDCRDKEGLSAMDSPRWASLSFFPRNPCNLTCLAIDVILDCQIDYEGVLAKGHINLIDLHR